MDRSFPYIREYADDEKARICDMLTEAHECLPFSIMHPLQCFEDYLNKQEYLKAMICMLDFFEIASQYITAVLFTLMKEESLLNDKELEKVINIIDTKRSLSFGDWANDIFCPVAKKAHNVLPESALASMICEKVFPKKNNLFTNWGKEPSLVSIRNNYKGHGSLLSEEIYKNVIYSVESRIWLFLEGMMPLKEYSFFSYNATEEKATFFNRCDQKYENGLPIDKSIKSNHIYFYHRSSKKLYDASPLLIYDQVGFVYIFQTLKDENMYFISANEKAVPLTTMDYNDDFDELFKRFVPSFDINKEKNWDEILKLVIGETKSFLAKIYKEKKYNRELFVDRKVLSSFFREFISGDKTLFPLLGEAGQGKTNQLCFWGESLVKSNRAAFLFSSNEFSNITIEEKLRNIFSFNKRKPIEKLLDNLHDKAQENNEYIFFIFDALNECLNYKDSENIGDGALDIYHDIRKLLVSDKYPRFKTLFTIRSYTWKRLIQKELCKEDPFMFTLDEGKEISISGFTDEELISAYTSYSRFFQTLTTIEELSSQEFRPVFIRLKDPLILKIACTNYMQKVFPRDISAFSSINLFELTMKELVNNYAGNIQRDILEEFAAILHNEYCKGNPKDNIYISDLKQAFNNSSSPLYSIAQNLLTDGGEGTSIAYGELLSKPGKPILRLIESDELSTSDNEQIQFIYERFLEYMLAKAFIKEERRKTNGSRIISADSYIKELQLSGANVVIMGALRNALIMTFLEDGDSSTIRTLALTANKVDNYEAMLLVTDVLNVMVRENYEDDLNNLISAIIADGGNDLKSIINEFKVLTQRIEIGKGTEEEVIKQLELIGQINPVAKMRELASMTMNGIFQTDYFNEDLYNNPSQLYDHLWRLLLDPIDKVRNGISLYVYYLSKVNETSGYSPVKENIADKIVREIFKKIDTYSIGSILFSSQKRKEAIELIESGVRNALVLIIDSLVLETPPNYERTKILKEQIEIAFRHFTGNFALVKIVMPLLKTVLRRQVTVQAMYVNNSVEYQRFWNDDCIPPTAEDGDHWSRYKYKLLAPFLRDYYKQEHSGDGASDTAYDFRNYYPVVLDAYTKGDSFSYFLLERVLVIQGLCNWERIRPIVVKFFDEYRDNPLFDYSQMSMLYVLFQIIIKSDVPPPKEMFDIFYRECDDWERRCKGLFNAHNNYFANHGNPYKQYMMNWYSIVYCRHTGDGNAKEGDETPVPIFYKMVKDAYNTKDKELFFNCIENISVSVSDFGQWKTALPLLKYTMDLITEQKEIDEIDAIQIPGRDDYNVPITSFFGKVLGTIKNYFPKEVDSFVKKELSNSRYPGIDKYREDILNYNPSGETIGDLLTHKFGNFIVWGLMYNDDIGLFAEKTYAFGSTTKDYFDWFDSVIRLAFKSLFNVKI